MSRRFPLSIAGREAATAVALRFTKLWKVPDREAARLATELLNAYFKGRHSGEVMGRAWSQNTWLIANLQPGEGRHFRGQSLQLLRQRFPSARKLMDNPLANWRCTSLPSGEVRVVRMPDGLTNQRDPLENPKVRELVSLHPGEQCLAKTITATRGGGALGSNSKTMARRYLKNDLAQWTVHRSEHGIILTRTV